MLAASDALRRTVQQGVPASWRNVVSQPQRTTFEGHEPVEWWGTRDGFVVDGVRVLELSAPAAKLLTGASFAFMVAALAVGATVIVGAMLKGRRSPTGP